MTEPRQPHRHGGARGAQALGLVVGIAAVAIIGAAGPSGDDRADAARSKPPAQPIVVTNRWGEYRPTCGPRHLAKRLRRFTRAVQMVRPKVLRRLWGRQFAAFGIAVRGTVTRAVDTYEEGLALLRRRGGLRLRFKEVQLNGGGGVGIDGAFRSRETGRKVLHGKAELSCRRPTIIAMSLWTETSHRQDLANCPEPTSPLPANPMIVCDRRAEAGPTEDQPR